MLHSTCKGKSNLYKRYLGERDGKEKKIYEEDEITSIILGPQDFLPVSEVYYFWKLVLENSSYQEELPQEMPSNADVSLWPIRHKSFGTGTIEPDATIVFNWLDKRRLILLLEFKWRAPLSGGEQLHHQWNDYLSDSERKDAIHIFIAPEISAGSAAKNNELGDVWLSSKGRGRLVLLPWLLIRDTLQDISNTKQNAAIGRWAELVNTFLAKVGINNFQGFIHIIDTIPSIETGKYPLFWHPFSGVGTIGPAPSIPKTITDPLFFSEVL
jgi:hypothetical protein